MLGRGIAISQPFAGARPTLDQRGARPVMAQQVDRLKRTRKTAADDRDVRRSAGQMT
jgi:hypothetical protein